MSDREALEEALELLYEPNSDEQGRNTTPVRYPLDVIGAAAQERLAQLARMCDRCAGMGVLGLMESVCFDCDGHGKVYPTERIEPIFGLIYEAFGSEDAPECRDLAVRILTLALNGETS